MSLLLFAEDRLGRRENQNVERRWPHLAKGTTVRMWRRTTTILFVLILGGFGIVIASLFRLQIVQGEELEARAVNQQTQDTVLNAQRGTIYDCNMTVLAKSASVWKVIANPNYIKTDEAKQQIAAGLAKILDLDESEVLQKLQKKTYYVKIAGEVETDVKDEILKFKEENDLGYAITLEEDYKRYYPEGDSAAVVLGFTNAEHQGVTGVEGSYNDYLSGTAGKLVTARNARGSDMPFQYEQKVEAQNGCSLVLTIDENIQRILENAVEDAAAACGARNRACGIVMNVKTGAILGMTVSEDFDPNEPYVITNKETAKEIEKLEGEEKSEALREAQEQQWRNKCISDTYNPGSVFKMLTSCMGIEEGVITEDSPFTCTGHYQVADRSIGCWRTAGHGSETFQQGLSNSCNPVFMQVAERLGADTFFRYFEGFGMTQKTGIDLIGESTSIYYDAAGLGPTQLATSSFGQSFRVTPIQMITAAAAVANGGYLVQPHVVSQILDDEGNIVKTIDTSVKRQVVSEDTSRRVSSMLQYTATVGTAKNGYVAGYRVAGKTGTSEKIDEWNAQGRKGDKKYIASYCGYAPADDPEIVMLVFFDEPLSQEGQVFGSAIAGPVFAEVMSQALPYLGIEPQYTEEELTKLDAKTPSVTGDTVKTAKEKIMSQSLSSKVYGDGDTVISQIPAAGDTIPKGGTVMLFTDESSEEEMVEVPNLVGLNLSQANTAASDAGLNISISGAALTGSNAVSDTQSIKEGEKVPPGTVVEVNFVELDTVH